MKKILLLLLLSVTAIAQDSTKNFSRFQLGLSIMPEIDLIDFDKTFSSIQPSLNHNIGTNLNYRINQKFSIETGLQYYDSRGKFELNSNDRGELFFQRTKTSAKSIRTPLKLIMILGKRKTQFIASAGVLLHFGLSSSYEVNKFYSDRTEYKKTNEPISTFRDLFPSPMISLGAFRKINNKVNIRIEPTLWRPNLDSSRFLVDYVCGINFGAYYNL